MKQGSKKFNPLNAELNPIGHLLELLVTHHIFHVNGLRVKSGGLHEKHVIVTWSLGNHLSIRV